MSEPTTKENCNGRPQVTLKGARPQVACVYLGVARKERLAARAAELGYSSLSDYLCALIDYGLTVPKPTLEKRRKKTPAPERRKGGRRRKESPSF